ncbi:MAG TPA: phosphatase PAP2 family protein [Sedimentisphaerales bacterium]|nr:phosphatase PAP2 family protein [Sedimentisphaerales bacterium]HRS12170.1 phosphatase PAP2 family protein [Sedimentisphaerales bacterium]HRV48121.1 phosphatase PAP2 family protein [Sedimentisphaerales bacterium]
MMPCPSSSSSQPVAFGWNRFFLGLTFILLVGSLASWAVLDQGIITWVVDRGIDPDDNLWVELFTWLGKAWVLIWLLLVWFAASRQRRDVLGAILALVIVGAAVTVLKLAVGRVRPYSVLKAQEAGVPLRKASHHFSFPSGDAASVFAVAGVLAPSLGWPGGPMLLGAAGAVGGLRVTSLAHYPSDVLAGMAIGLLAGWLAMRLIPKWKWADRPLPFEEWLVRAGIVGLPVGMGFSEGPRKLFLFTKSYGVLVLGAVALARLWGLWQRRGREVVLPLLVRTRYLVISLVMAACIVENVVDGEKPHELLPFHEPISPFAAVGFALVVAGVVTRLWFLYGVRFGRHLSARSDASGLLWPQVGTFLIVCGLLTQLSDWMNWLVVVPVFILLEGLTSLSYRSAQEQRESAGAQLAPAESRHFSGLLPVHGRRPSSITGRLGQYWLTASLVLLPIALELIVEEFICETLLRMS